MSPYLEECPTAKKSHTGVKIAYATTTASLHRIASNPQVTFRPHYFHSYPVKEHIKIEMRVHFVFIFSQCLHYDYLHTQTLIPNIVFLLILKRALVERWE